MSRETNSWEGKVHRVFRLGAEAFKEAVQAIKKVGPNPPPKIAQRIEGRLFSKLQEIWIQYPDLKSPTTGLLYSSSPDLRLNDVEHLHWRRHGKLLHQDRARVHADDLDAFGRVNRTMNDYVAWRRGQYVKDFKIDPDHWTLLEMGFDFGLNDLSAEELADCFDALCPCGRSHDADALKKQRSRLKSAIKKAQNP
jgi:hypothetical protein